MVKISRGSICILFAFLFIYLVAGLILLTTMSLPNGHEKRTRRDMEVRVRSYEGKANYRGASRPPRMVWCQPLRFLTGTYRPTIALVSFPGSGNTWLRYLLQQATGINTGSVYKDYGLLKNGFPGECIANSSVSVVKTHERGPLAFQGYSKAVLLVRDPSKAIQAEFNRQGGGHIGFAPPHRYKLRNGKYWERFVDEQIIKWKNTNLDWLFNYTRPIFIIFYEDLVNDLETNLRELISFLELDISEDNIQCALNHREGIYRRKKKLMTLDPFTEKMKKKIEAIKENVYWHLHAYIQSHRTENR